MRFSTACIATAFSLGLAGCGAHPANTYTPVNIPIAIGCVVDRPAPVAPLNQRVPAAEWAARAPGAKAESVRAQAGVRMNHDDALAAATAGCTNAPVAAK